MNNRTRKELAKLAGRLLELQAGVKSVGTSGMDKDAMLADLNECVEEAQAIYLAIQHIADTEAEDNEYLAEASQMSATPIQDIVDALKNDTAPNWDIDYTQIVEALEMAEK